MTVILVFSLLVNSSVAHSNIPKRIVSLKPNITELLFAIGAGDQVVGVTTWCNKPDGVKDIPKVADYINVNVEKIIALRPDLVVSSEENSLKEPVEALKNARIPVLLLPFKKVDDLFVSTLKLSRAVGREKEGIEVVKTIKKIVERRTTNDERRTTVLIIVGKHPLIAAGQDTFLSEITEIAGGNNIIHGAVPYPNINIETVMEKDPDVIIDLSMGSEEDNPEKIYGYWKQYPINAVRNRRIFVLNISDFRIGPEIIEQVEKLKRIMRQPIPSPL